MPSFLGQPNDGAPSPALLVLIPVYNDWETLALLLRQLDLVLMEHGLETEVMVVDDASTIPCPPRLMDQGLPGHQVGGNPGSPPQPGTSARYRHWLDLRG